MIQGGGIFIVQKEERISKVIKWIQSKRLTKDQYEKACRLAIESINTKIRPPSWCRGECCLFYWDTEDDFWNWVYSQPDRV